MLRFQSHNPQEFLKILQFGGCFLGPSNSVIQAVFRPGQPHLCSFIRMDQPVHPETRKAHLENLGITENEFFSWFENYQRPPQN